MLYIYAILVYIYIHMCVCMYSIRISLEQTQFIKFFFLGTKIIAE